MTDEQKQLAKKIIEQWEEAGNEWEQAEVGCYAVELLKEIVNEND